MSWWQGLIQKIEAFQLGLKEALIIVGGLLIEILVIYYLIKNVVKLLNKVNELRDQNKGWREIGNAVMGTVAICILLIAIGGFVGVFMVLRTPVTAIVTEMAVYIFAY